MNDNAKRWVEALRSGQYEQTRNDLRDENGYCCLGVACELYREVTGRGEWERDEDGFTQFLDRALLLPEPVREWLGLRTEGGDFIDRAGDRSSLAERNDEGATFDEIADIIESELEGLFS